MPTCVGIAGLVASVLPATPGGASATSFSEVSVSDADGNMYVLNGANTNVYEHSLDNTWGWTVIGNGTSMVSDADGNMYVLNGANSNVYEHTLGTGSEWTYIGAGTSMVRTSAPASASDLHRIKASSLFVIVPTRSSVIRAVAARPDQSIGSAAGHSRNAGHRGSALRGGSASYGAQGNLKMASIAFELIDEHGFGPDKPKFGIIYKAEGGQFCADYWVSDEEQKETDAAMALLRKFFGDKVSD